MCNAKSLATLLGTTVSIALCAHTIWNDWNYQVTSLFWPLWICWSGVGITSAGARGKLERTITGLRYHIPASMLATSVSSSPNRSTGSAREETASTVTPEYLQALRQTSSRQRQLPSLGAQFKFLETAWDVQMVTDVANSKMFLWNGFEMITLGAQVNFPRTFSRPQSALITSDFPLRWKLCIPPVRPSLISSNDNFSLDAAMSLDLVDYSTTPGNIRRKGTKLD